MNTNQILTLKYVNLSLPFPLKIETLFFGNQQDTPLHTHEFCEIGISLEGEATHYSETTTQKIHEGDVYLVKAGTYHSITSSHNWKVCNIYFLPELLENDMNGVAQQCGLFPLFFYHLFFGAHNEIPIIKLDANDFLCIQQYLSMIKNTIINPEGARNWYQKNCFTNILLLLTKYLNQNNAISSKQPLEGRLQQTLLLITQNLHLENKLIIEKACKHLQITPEYICTLFQIHLHTNVSQYILRLKIMKACTGLLQPHSNITEIALSLGFYDHAHFSKQFKKIINMSPSQYRNTYSTM